MILTRTSGLRLSLKVARMAGMLLGEMGMIGSAGSAAMTTPGCGVGNQGCSSDRGSVSAPSTHMGTGTRVGEFPCDSAEVSVDRLRD